MAGNSIGTSLHESARTEFLKSVWQPYPAADRTWFDVSEFVERNQSDFVAGVVAGRISEIDLSARTLNLESDGARVEIKLTEKTDWMRATQTPFSATLLRTGDLVAIEVNAAESEAKQPAEATRLLLLVPTRNGNGYGACGSGTDVKRLNGSFSPSRSKDWSNFLMSLREFFTSQRFIEVQTPTLVPSPGTEPFLDPFKTEWELGSTTRTLYLPTSPEFHLKQMLARGWSRIFEFKTCFRNGEIGEHHQPEFLMLEWYRAYSNLEAIANDVAGLFKLLATRTGADCQTLERTTIAELFEKHFDGFELTPKTTRDELATLARRSNISIQSSDSFDDIFFRLFLDRIESQLGIEGPLLVSHYPPSQAALSRIGPHGFAERFEVYWNGLELANAFHELNDPFENEERFRKDAETKAALGKPAVPRDENLVEALQNGMPPSGGIALGVDRLFMALYKLKTIDETRAFPLRP